MHTLVLLWLSASPVRSTCWANGFSSSSQLPVIGVKLDSEMLSIWHVCDILSNGPCTVVTHVPASEGKCTARPDLHKTQEQIEGCVVIVTSRWVCGLPFRSLEFDDFDDTVFQYGRRYLQFDIFFPNIYQIWNAEEWLSDTGWGSGTDSDLSITR